jgi:hypothetical protein
MLQKIVNGIAIASGVVSLTVIGLGGYVFIRKDAIIENVKSKVMESVLPGGLSGGLGLPSPSSAVPDAPAASPMSPIPLGF